MAHVWCLQLDRTTVNASTFRIQTRMKEQMTRHYNEQTYHDASQQTKNLRRLHQTDSSMRKLMSMPRKTFYMETEHEMSNILTSDSRPTTMMQEVWIRLQQHHGTLVPSLPSNGILARTYDDQTRWTRGLLGDREATVAILNSHDSVPYE